MIIISYLILYVSFGRDRSSTYLSISVFHFVSVSLLTSSVCPLFYIATVVLNNLDSLTLILTLVEQKEQSLDTQQFNYIFRISPGFMYLCGNLFLAMCLGIESFMI